MLATEEETNIPEQIVDGVFMIYNAQDLMAFNTYVNETKECHTDASARLCADIDCSEIALWSPLVNSGTVFVYKGYSGTFDGQHHRIKNLVIEQSMLSTGFFGYLTGGAVIKDLIIDASCSIQNSSSPSYMSAGIAGCVGSNESARGVVRIENCCNEMNISNAYYAAGIVASVNNQYCDLEIVRCYNTGNITASTSAAAIVSDRNDKCTIKDSWNSGNIVGAKDGKTFAGGTSTATNAIQNCFSTTAQDGVTAIDWHDIFYGKLCYMLNGSQNGSTAAGWYQNLGRGRDDHPVTVVGDNGIVYCHQGRYCDTSDGAYIPLYTNNAIDDDLPVHVYDKDGYCTQKEGELHGEYPPLVDGVYQISRPTHLYGIGYLLSVLNIQHDCVLINDITMNEDLIVDGKFNSEKEATFKDWKSIGDAMYAFKSRFDGQYHTISGLYCSQRGHYNNLFGYVEDAEIRNVGLINSYLNGQPYSPCPGALIGRIEAVNKDVVVENCYTTGFFYNIDGEDVGSLIGEYVGARNNHSLKVNNCYGAMKAYNYDEDKNIVVATCPLIHGESTEHIDATKSYFISDNITESSVYGTPMTELQFSLGEVCQTMNANPQATCSWQQAIDHQNLPVFGKGGVSYSRTVSADSWGSIVLPFKVSSDSDIQFYDYKNVFLDGDDFEEATLTLESVKNVEANTPCFFKTKNGITELSFSPSDGVVKAPATSLVKDVKYQSSDIKYSFVGSYEDATISSYAGWEQNYYLAQNKMWYGDQPFSLPAFRIYLETSAPWGAKTLNIIANDDATAIRQPNSTSYIVNSTSYNLNGQPVDANTKGLIIKNGKKIITK